jgi:hypothetical protein
MIPTPPADDRPHLIAVNRFYWPDCSATGQLLTDVCEHAAANGFRVTVVTGRTRYDAAECFAAREQRAGVEIRRVWATGLGRDGTPGRLIDYLTFALSAFLALLAIARRGDVILAKTDPPLLSVPVWIAARLRGARGVNWLQDLFPEVADQLGMTWVRGPVGRLLRLLRDRSLAAAETNVVICESMGDLVAARGARRGQLRVIPNWPDPGIRPVAREGNRLRTQWGLADRFVIGYSGNLGRPHAAGAVAELIRRTAGLERISWLFIGGGSGHRTVRAAAEQAGVPIVFQGYQPRERLSESLSVPDLHLVSLDPACEGLLMPSKLYGVMAAGRPILALGDPHGAVATEVRRGVMGVALDIAAPDAWLATVAAVSTPDVTDAMGSRARTRFEAAFRPTPLLDCWLEVLRDAVPAAEQPATRAALAP